MGFTVVSGAYGKDKDEEDKKTNDLEIFLSNIFILRFLILDAYCILSLLNITSLAGLSSFFFSKIQVPAISSGL